MVVVRRSASVRADLACIAKFPLLRPARSSPASAPSPPPPPTSFPCLPQDEALGEGSAEDLHTDPVCTSPAECGPHGSCEAGRCRCVALYTGVVCGHALVLSPALLAPGLPAFEPAYEGELMLHARSRYAEIRVLRPGPAREWELLADAEETAALNKVLPPADVVFKVGL